MRKKKTANRNFLGGPYANFPYRVSRLFPIGLQTIPSREVCFQWQNGDCYVGIARSINKCLVYNLCGEMHC